MASARVSLGDLVEWDIVEGEAVGSSDLLLDIPVLVDTRLMVTGQSGAGKSRLLRRLAEQCFGHVQIVLLDPEGEFSTLREKHDFLLVGPGGEAPAEPRAAALLARRLLELRVSAVIDLSDLKLPARREFVRLFLEALTDMPKDLQHPLLVMIDEAHLFCPEKSAGEAESTAAVIDLMSRGRKRGQAGILATQRVSKLNKDAAAEAKNVIVGGITLDLDQKRAADSLGITGAKERVALRDLPSGTFFAYGPALSRRGVSTFEVGPSQTTHPRAGQRHKVVAPAPPQAIKALAEELKDLPQQAAEEVRTLDAAKARIRELERAAKAGPPAPPAPKAKEVEVVKPAALKRLDDATARLAKDGEALLERMQGAVRLAEEAQVRIEGALQVERGRLERDRAAFVLRLADAIAELAQRQQVVTTEAATLRALVARAGGNPIHEGEKGAGAVPGRRPGPPAAPAPVVPIAPATAQEVAAAGFVGPAGRKILRALLDHGGRLTRAELGVVSLYRADAGHFGNLISELRSSWHLEPASKDGMVVLTPIGSARAAETAAPEIKALDAWVAKLGGVEGRLLGVIAAAPEGLTRAEVAAATGYRADAGHFGNLLSTQRANGVVVEGARKGVMKVHPLLRTQEAQ